MNQAFLNIIPYVKLFRTSNCQMREIGAIILVRMNVIVTTMWRNKYQFYNLMLKKY